MALKPSIVLLLTDESADATALIVSVFFEPLAEVVVALSHTERKMSIGSNAEMWHSNEPGFKGLIDQAEDFLEHGETMEALLLCIRELPKIIAQS